MKEVNKFEDIWKSEYLLCKFENYVLSFAENVV